jgi:ankyrin repeat protein
LISAPELSKHSCHGYCDIVKCLLTSGADINFRDKGGQTPFYVAASGGYYDIVILLTAHGALREENVKTQYKTISKGTKDDEFPTDTTALLKAFGYLEEEINHSKEKQVEKKEAIYVPKVQEGKEETIITREKEDKEEIIYQREAKEESDEKIEGRKEQVEKGEIISIRKEKVEIDNADSYYISDFGFSNQQVFQTNGNFPDTP